MSHKLVGKRRSLASHCTLTTDPNEEHCFNSFTFTYSQPGEEGEGNEDPSPKRPTSP